MAKTIYLHVGMPKCASTTVQAYLWRERAALAEAGIQYRMFHDREAPLLGNGDTLAEAIWAQNRRGIEDRLTYFMGLPGTVLISAEAFSNIFNTATMAETIRTMQARGAQVKVICFFRRQDLWIESDYKQQIKGGHPWDAPISELIALRLRQEVLNFGWTMAYWIKFVGEENAFAVPINPGEPRDKPVRSLLRYIGADTLADGPLTLTEANVSPPTGLIEPARLLKRKLAGKGTHQAETETILQTFFDTAPGLLDVPSRRFLLPHAERVALVARYKGSNAVLQKQSMQGARFHTEFEQDPASEAPLEPEAKAVLGAYLSANRDLSNALSGGWRRLFRWRAP
ncbi:hypothetical protein EI983_00210 (plasmid) [Roseovarius faecimaris]|uniref:Uncharacterized protein n=1 Tax=Roseovarius faecimaris TaxID=2494550 RepID=A0A6I6INL6_9RHOB|nr:hypothetical protein [Roseovarius faecimaris]QGX96776.1 hypothetical protein EI983_00210 [Roseovarius faecimaris]